MAERSPARSSRGRHSGIPFLALLLLPTTTHAQVVDEGFWCLDGQGLAAAVSGNTLYVGGLFNYVGPWTGGCVPLDPSSAIPLTGFPKVRGTVGVIVPDGAGGFYLGGTFDQVGGQPRQNLARVLADLSVAAWNPEASGPVAAIAVAGGTVYLGGAFTTMNGQSRANLAAVEATTGALQGWNPSANGSVRTLVVSGTTVYAGG